MFKIPLIVLAFCLPIGLLAQNTAKRLETVDDYIVQENYAYAERLLVKILNRDQGIHQAHYKLALVRWQKGENKKALDEAVMAVKQKPEEPNYHALLGKIWLELNENDKGLEQFETALLIDSLLPEALLYRGDYYAEIQEFKLAIKDYRSLHKVVSTEPQILFRIAKAYYSLNNYYKAIEYFEKCLKINAIDLESKWLLANSFYETKQYDKAIFELNQLQKLQPLDEQLLLRAQCLMAQNMLHEARSDMAFVLGRNKTDFNYGLVFISIEEQLGNFANALVFVDALIARFPALRPLLILKGRILAKLKDYQKAEKVFKLAIEGIENEKTPFVNEAKAYINLISWVSGFTRSIAYTGCDSLAIYSWLFTKDLLGNPEFSCPDDGYYLTYKNLVVGGHSAKAKLVLALAKWQKNHDEGGAKDLLISLHKNQYFTCFEYHAAQIILAAKA